jgi:transposase
VFCGIDWAEGHHDVALVDETGQLVAKKRIHESVTGFAELMAMFEAAGDTADDPIPVAIETPRGLLVAALRATGRPVFAINPMAVARYRERISVSRTKSDHADAMALANILRTDAHLHRRIAADSELVQSIAVLARAHQDAIWRRTKASNELRSLLREYYPAYLEVFAGKQATNLAHPEARAVLAIATDPAAAAKLSKARLAAVLKKAGRRRFIEPRADELQAAFREPRLRQPALVEQAMGRQALALLATLDVECRNVNELSQATTAAFQQHPDHGIITSFPGLSDNLGARVLAEIGDDRTRFADARAVKAYAGSAPTTRASGRSRSISFRRIKNDRLAAAGYVWAFAAMANHEPATAHYRRRRDHGDRHSSALRNLFNRQLGQLWNCLQTGQHYDRSKAFTSPADPITPPPLTEAAA